MKLQLCRTFCSATREQLEEVLADRGGVASGLGDEAPVSAEEGMALTVRALQLTKIFERRLDGLFGATTCRATKQKTAALAGLAEGCLPQCRC